MTAELFMPESTHLPPALTAVLADSVNPIVIWLAILLLIMGTLALGLLWRLYVARQDLTRTHDLLRQEGLAKRSLLDAFPFPVVVKDNGGAYLHLNRAAKTEMGLGESSEGSPFRIETDIPTGQWLEKAGDRARETGEDCSEINYISAPGLLHRGLWWERPMQSADGAVRGSVGLLLDITRFRDRERDAALMEQGLRDITRRIPVVIFSVTRGPDRLLRVPFLIGNLHTMFGLDIADLLDEDGVCRDEPLYRSIHAEDIAGFRQFVEKPDKAGQGRSIEFRAYGEDGLHWIHLSMMAHRLESGRLQWTGYFIDTTRINEDNEQLRLARDAAEKAAKAKADFLATMSHEIRTPMNGIIGMLELLGRTSITDEQADLLGAVEDSAGVLLQVLNDVLDFSKLETSNLRLDEQPFDPRILVDNVISSMATYINQKGLRIHVGVDPVIAGMLVGDSVRLRQILLNLLNNAAKFTEQGSVTVRLKVLSDDGATQRVRLTVADTGIGIAADKQAGLFTPFVQAEAWTNRRYGGTGLGLAISRRLIQLMNGRISLSSEEGVGTTVSVELRLPIGQRGVDRPPGLAGHHAIVRLRSSETAASLSEHLAALGMTSEQVPPTAILRDGISASLLFVDDEDRTSSARVAAKVIAIVDAADTPGQSDAVDDRLLLSSNPLKWQAVMRACLESLVPTQASPRPTLTLEPTAGRDATPPDDDAFDTLDLVDEPDDTAAADGWILVAEDHPISQELIRRQMALLGRRATIVSHGQEALEALLGGHYDLLITDCHMPQMNGYELAIAWRRHEREQRLAGRLPIIAMTANVMPEDIAACAEAGMDDYLAKPLQIRVLEQALERWMPLKPVEDDFPPELRDVRNEMLAMLIATCNEDLPALRQSAIDGDAAKAFKRLHRVLGTLPMFTDSPLVARGRTILDDLRGSDSAAVLPGIPAFADDLDRLLGTLSREASLHSR